MASVASARRSILASPSSRLNPGTFRHHSQLVDPTKPLWTKSQISNSIDLLQLRGGATSQRTKKKSKSSSSKKSKTATGKVKVGEREKDAKSTSAVGDLVKKYRGILPLTRVYITMVVVATLLGLVLGEELTQTLLALDPMRVMYGLELWRPFTAASFLGPPSIGWLMSGYYLFEYGSSLERAFGTAQHFVFLMSMVVFLTITSTLMGQPFFAPSMITAMLHVLSRAMPRQKVKWLVFTVPYWSLPYGLMVTDVLQAKQAAAAVPHILGILAGHFYHFHKNVWPKMGGEDWLAAPDFLVRRLDGKPTLSTKTSEAKDSIKSALHKTRKKGKGRKLGGSSKKK